MGGNVLPNPCVLMMLGYGKYKMNFAPKQTVVMNERVSMKKETKEKEKENFSH
jgi:hypothetical protein